MPNTKYFLDEAGTKFLVQNIMSKIDDQVILKLNASIVTTIDDQSTDSQIPSAKAVYGIIQESLSDLSGIKFEVVDVLPDVGDPSTIYLIKANPSDPDDTVYVQWIYVGDRFINLGSNEIDLAGYWSKEELKPLSNEDIKAIVDEIFGDE